MTSSAPSPRPPEHDDFGGLQRDLPAFVGRRRALQLLGGASLVGLLAACSSSDPSTGSTGSTAPATSGSSSATAATGGAATATGGVTASAGAEIPDETRGPYPADGSNGPDVLGIDGIVRADITSSVGDRSGTADGVPLAVQLTVVDHSTGSPVAGAAVYAWHCTADGRYSVYEVTDQNYLRGIQVADSTGKLTFTTIFPGCYAGRWPHIHVEVYPSLDEATAGTASIKTSQLALPESDCAAVYADSRYGDSSGSLGRLSLDTDNVFRDGWTEQLATVSGSAATGYTASLLVRV
ncbi:MAG: hypothetical protein R2761_11075 [Acidimicrobiales bacterium]